MIAVSTIFKGLPQMVDFYNQTISIVLIYHLGPLNMSDRAAHLHDNGVQTCHEGLGPCVWVS
jgi:hypothetical protein